MSANLDADALLSQIYADPVDDALRSVYADLLAQRGDPRGEFITLQLLGREERRSRAAAARERELLAKHRERWLGPLAPVLQGDVRFRRGFPVAGRLAAPSLGRARAVIGEPAWRTFERLHVGRRPPAELLLHPALAGLRQLRGISLEVALALASAAPARPLELLDIAEPLPADGATEPLALAEAPGLPRLRRLSVTAVQPLGPAFSSYRWLLSSALAHRLERLSLRCWWGHQPNWLRAALELPEPPPELQLLPTESAGWRCLLRRHGGRLSELALRYRGRRRPYAGDRLVELLSRLPARSLVTLRVETSAGLVLDDGQRGRLERQVERLQLANSSLPDQGRG